MQKQNFEKFYAHTVAYDFLAACGDDKEAKNAVVSLYLSCEQDSYIEYGDFHIDSFADEFHELLVGDGYLEPDGGIADKVERILSWQVWVNFVEDEHPHSGVHLYNFTDEGIEEIKEYVKFSAVEE